ncbi:Serine palmitoyltransferase 2 [Zancudomyces culisetae]|uniref:serine C-palmitoyltransferase n=1 Tax=Zancudomyces culisetae TaxID=1213189 RepID=A0A1R1PRR2_ZANCU|nr:Serine palmitoyltransferase 2 [Zancudomyces culisetae]|eukprot:OMH83676.1 Serine palmitoyltransferase 2 [Zancudomyces culisetae]
MFAHIRDRFGKIFYPEEYTSLKEVDGYAPLITDFESLWNRRLYTRISDAFNRPITGVAGGSVALLERESKDYNRTFRLTGGKKTVLNLASYNYLGFAQSEGYCADTVEDSLRTNGIGMSMPRNQGGQTKKQIEVEKMVARYLGVDDAVVVSMGYATNSTVIPLLTSKGTLIISDELNHSSLVSGARMSGATIAVFKHGDTKDLEAVLRRRISQGQPRTHRPWRNILVVVEGLYSMEGEFCDLVEIVRLKKQYKFNIYLDEAHSIGAIGKTGRGVCEYFGVDFKDVDILMGTFTKSFGAVGGYIAGRKDIIEHMRLSCYSNMYTECMPYPVLAQVESSLQLMMDEVPDWVGDGPARIRQLAENSEYFFHRLIELGFLVLGSPGSPVVPLLLFNPGKIPAFSRMILERNIAVVVVSYPATPIIAARVRFCISASHSREDLDYALEQIDEVGDLLNLKLAKK